MHLESVVDKGSDFNLEVKACAEALQSAQKRARIAFFLSLSASCIVLLMILNLLEARQLRNTELIKNDAPNRSEYLKEFSKHLADDSFYQLPALGIQITCDDVGFLGPLALFVFSFYSLTAFKACNGQALCAKRFANCELVSTLLKSEMVPGIGKPVYWSLSFLPFTACILVVIYRVNSYFFYGAPISDPLHEVLTTTRSMAHRLDVAGWVLIALVLICNIQVVRSSWKTKREMNDCLKPHPKAETHNVAKGASGATL